jgi:hypothetical protein
MRMLKELTFMGKLDAGDPHKEYWWKVTPQKRLKIANEHILRIFQIKSWDKFPMQKKIVSTRKLADK